MIKSDYVRLDQQAIGELLHRRINANLKICTVIKAAKLSTSYGYRIERGQDVPAIAIERYKKALDKLSQEQAAI
jgi:hypothetical protein